MQLGANPTPLPCATKERGHQWDTHQTSATDADRTLSPRLWIGGMETGWPVLDRDRIKTTNPPKNPRIWTYLRATQGHDDEDPAWCADNGSEQRSVKPPRNLTATWDTRSGSLASHLHGPTPLASKNFGPWCNGDCNGQFLDMDPCQGIIHTRISGRGTNNTAWGGCPTPTPRHPHPPTLTFSTRCEPPSTTLTPKPGNGRNVSSVSHIDNSTDSNHSSAKGLEGRLISLLGRKSYIGGTLLV